VAPPRGPARAAADAELATQISAVHATDRAYGTPRVTAELNDGAPPEARVNQEGGPVMAAHATTGIRLRRRVRTTIGEPSNQPVPDLVDRQFTAEEPNTVYVGDITYLPRATGQNLYLATVINCCSRRLVGSSIADPMRTDLVTDALLAAAAAWAASTGVVFHSDHGPSARPGPTTSCATGSGSAGRWALSGPAPSTPWPSPSTSPSSASPSPAPPAGTPESTPAARCSRGPPATTPAAGTPPAARPAHDLPDPALPS